MTVAIPIPSARILLLLEALACNFRDVEWDAGMEQSRFFTTCSAVTLTVTFSALITNGMFLSRFFIGGIVPHFLVVFFLLEK